MTGPRTAIPWQRRDGRGDGLAGAQDARHGTRVKRGRAARGGCVLSTPDGPTLRLRAATFADAAFLLALRNAPDARAASPADRVIPREEHERWLAAALDDPLRLIFVAEVGARAVGSVRAEASAPGAPWRLSWAVDPDARGRGHAKTMLARALDGLRGEAVASIADGHAASEAVARHAGLVPDGAPDADGFRLWRRRLEGEGERRESAR